METRNQFRKLLNLLLLLFLLALVDHGLLLHASLPHHFEQGVHGVLDVDGRAVCGVEFAEWPPVLFGDAAYEFEEFDVLELVVLIALLEVLQIGLVGVDKLLAHVWD